MIITAKKWLRKQRIDQTLMMNRITVKKRGGRGRFGLEKLAQNSSNLGKKIAACVAETDRKKGLASDDDDDDRR